MASCILVESRSPFWAGRAMPRGIDAVAGSGEMQPIVSPPPTPAPRNRKGIPPLLFTVAIVVAAVAAGGGVYVYTQYATHLAVTGINWQVYVNNTLIGYVFNSEESGCQAQCPANAQVNSVWIYTLALSSESSNFTVVNVTLPLPFQIVGTSPALPKEVVVGSGSASFRIAIQLPANPGSYSVLGAVWIAS
jgi:hypothetical protein